jgi:hypothetical protein
MIRSIIQAYEKTVKGESTTIDKVGATTTTTTNLDGTTSTTQTTATTAGVTQN